eukprot:7347-Heterococcus_DN1.PRE.2
MRAAIGKHFCYGLSAVLPLESSLVALASLAQTAAAPGTSITRCAHIINSRNHQRFRHDIMSFCQPLTAKALAASTLQSAVLITSKPGGTNDDEAVTDV